MKILTTMIFCLFFHQFGIGQVHFPKNTTNAVGIQVNLSGSGQTPFWIRSNKHGTVPVASNYVALTASSLKQYDSLFLSNGTLQSWDWGYGIETLSFSRSDIPRIILPEAYVKMRFKKIEFFGGRRKEIIGLVDSTLSSGSFAWSGNSIAIPQIKVHIPNYVPIVGKGLISFKGSFSHGWYGKQNYLTNVQLHHKSLYFKLGRPSWKLNFYSGFNHQMQFGGKLYRLNGLRSIRNGNFPNTFKDYILGISGISLSSVKDKILIDENDYTGYDLTNRIGNHLGTIDIGLQLFQKTYQFKIYRQSFYDDGSLFRLTNLQDGLLGGSVSFIASSKNIRLRAIVFEYFSSINQGGRVAHFQTTNPYLLGWDDYYNHGQFVDGWSNKTRSSGTPFILNQQEVRVENPNYLNINGSFDPFKYYTNNNRLEAIYSSIEFSAYSVNINLKGSYSKNLGTYQIPFQQSADQLSFAMLLAYKIGNTTIQTNIGLDRGKLIQDNLGLIMGLSQTF